MKDMKHKLVELFNNIAIDKIYYPFGALCYLQDDLMYELAEKYDQEKLAEIFEGKNIQIWDDNEMEDIFSDWMSFNDWIKEENITGYFASILTPVMTNIELDSNGQYKSSSCSFGYCHIDFIYYESAEELLLKGYEIVEFWKSYDIEKAKAKQLIND